MAVAAWGPINRFKFELEDAGDGVRLVEGRPRTDLQEVPHGHVRVQICSGSALQRLAGGAMNVAPQEWLIPSWREDQFESLKRAVAEFSFVRFGARPWTTCFHLDEIAGEQRSVRSLHEDVWPGASDYAMLGAVDFTRVIEVVFDWGPNVDYWPWDVWPPALATSKL